MDRFEAVVALVSIVFGTGAAVAITYLIAQAALKFRKPPELDLVGLKQVEARLERMELAIDAMAVEMERVAEGQRFTTRLLSEGPGSPVPVPSRVAAEPGKP
jgi:hypothetical protein